MDAEVALCHRFMMSFIPKMGRLLRSWFHADMWEPGCCDVNSSSNAALLPVFSEGRGFHGTSHPPLLPRHPPLFSFLGLFGFTWDPLHTKLNLPIWDRETQDWSARFFLSLVPVEPFLLWAALTSSCCQHTQNVSASS